MPIHPDTADGYFVSGDPQTGNAPPGSKPGLDFFNALLDLLDAGGIIEPPSVTAVDITLAGQTGLFLVPAAGAQIACHLPVYATVAAGKSYRMKNTGQGSVLINAADGKTIDGELIMELWPGDKCLIIKDGTNWQTF